MITDRRQMRYVTFQNDLPEGWSPKECPAFDVAIPITKNWKTARRRVILVVEHVDGKDLKEKALLDRGTGATVVTNLLQFARRQCALVNPESIEESVAYATINFNFFKTYHLKGARRKHANDAASKRVKAFVRKMDPTNVIVFGDEAAESLLPRVDDISHKRGWPHAIKVRGKPVLVTNTIRYDHTYFLRGTDMDNDSDAESQTKMDEAITQANILGYIGRTLMSAFLDRLPFTASEVRPNPILIDTLSKFKRMMRVIKRAPVVSVDSETKNLSVHHNQLQTLQFSDNPDRAFILPVHHRDTPFSGSEFRTIFKELRAYFGQRVEWQPKSPRYLVMHNAKFDLRIIRQEFDLPFIYWPVWDTIAGEFCIHPESWVVTERGMVQMKDLVVMGNPPQVLSYNHKTQQEEYKPLLATSTHPTDQRMVEISYEGGSIRVTEDHEVWSVTRGSYVKAKNLTSDDEVLLQT